MLKGKNKLFDMLLPENVELIGEDPKEDPTNAGERYSTFRFREQDAETWASLLKQFDAIMQHIGANSDPY